MLIYEQGARFGDLTRFGAAGFVTIQNADEKRVARDVEVETKSTIPDRRDGLCMR